MTVPTMPAVALLDLAKQLGCVGVEFRNDLEGQLFDGADPEFIHDVALAHGLRILALAEVKAFNDASTDNANEALSLMKVATASGAESVALIPRVASGTVDRDLQRDALRRALQSLQPMLEDQGLVGLIEPLGFVDSSLRYKADVAAVLDEMNRPACFRIVHDTFHHHIAGGGAIYADLTGLVHISGITDNLPNVAQMADEHRVLLEPVDRLNSIDQLRALRKSGFHGVASFEAFAPEIHSLADPAAALARSIDFISSQLVGVPA